MTPHKNNVPSENLLFSPPNLIIKKIDDFYMALNPDIPNMMVVDEIGKKAFEISNGKRTEDEVIEYIRRTYRLDNQDAETFIQSLVKAGFLGRGTFLPFKEINKRAKKLTMLIYHVTQACNLRCKHCYFYSGAPLHDELSDEEWMDLTGKLENLGTQSLIISGGEPLLRKNLLFQMIKEARKQHVEKITLSTNGALLAKEDSEFFKKYDIDVGVSLDGTKAETHDFIRGKGSFEKAINAIRTLTRTGVNTTIGMALMGYNIEEAEEMVHLGKKLGVSGVHFIQVRVMGRAKNYADVVYVSPKDVVLALKETWRTSRELGVRTTVEQMWSTVKHLSRRNLCAAGRGMLSIAANGDVYPCDAFHGEESMKVGNVREMDLEKWKNSSVLKPFQNLTVTTIEGCKDCELKFICGGSCMADIYFAHGTFNKQSPLCSMFKEIYWHILDELAREMWRKA